MQLCFERVTFTYEGAPAPLFMDINTTFPDGWTGLVGVNGAGKTTILRLACGELEPQDGRISLPGTVMYCQQRTDDPPVLLPSFLNAVDAGACELRGRLQIGDDWIGRWETLSHGERKRAQIAVALWQQPSVLAIDEPTNHLDADARHLLVGALLSFDGIGLLVSHDRELLDTLCRQCLLVSPPTVSLRPGNYTRATEQAHQEEEALRREREQVKQSVQRLTQEKQRRLEQVERDNHRGSKRRLDRHDSDGRRKMDAARMAGKDVRAGQLARQLAGRMRQAEETLADIQAPKHYETGIWLPGSRSQRNTLFTLPAGELPLGEHKRLRYPELTMLPDDRIALIGANGTGKSTLIAHLLTQLALPVDRIIYLPQEISTTAAREIMRDVSRLSREELGLVMTIVSRLGSRPHRLLDNMTPSPGEIRKILLALGITRSPHLIIMDEPTNHLDLPAIECLEQALADCPCGLLLVSHDLYFLQRLTTMHWHIAEGDARGVMALQMYHEVICR